MSACSGTWEENGISQWPASAVAQQAPKTTDQVQLFVGRIAAQSYTVIKEVKAAVVNVDISGEKVRAFSWCDRTGSVVKY